MDSEGTDQSIHGDSENPSSAGEWAVSTYNFLNKNCTDVPDTRKFTFFVDIYNNSVVNV